MANVKALHLVGESLKFFLTNTYPKALSDLVKCEFTQFPTSRIPDQDPATTTIGLTLYRVGWNEHLRQGMRSPNRRQPLALDLHYLLTVWGKSAQEEQLPFAWALLQLHQYPLLDRSMLRGDGGWKTSEQIELLPQDLSHEQMARIWDKLRVPAYRLSAAFTARVLLIEPMIDDKEFLPVVARQDTYRGPLEEGER